MRTYIQVMSLKGKEAKQFVDDEVQLSLTMPLYKMQKEGNIDVAFFVYSAISTHFKGNRDYISVVSYKEKKPIGVELYVAK